MKNQKLIVWLGNPWKQYEKNRHNIWFLALDKIVKDLNINFHFEKKRNWEFAKKEIDGNTIFFLKPQTFMNLSWESVKSVSNFFQIKPEDILVIHDELDIEFWQIKQKDWWGHAWHNWLRDIITKLWTNTFHRFRLWIWRPPDWHDIAWYVLSNFSSEQQKDLEIILEKTQILFKETIINKI